MIHRGLAFAVPISLFLALTSCRTADEDARAQTGLEALSGPYFGQQEPGLQAQPFAPGLISLLGRYEFALSFSPGGDELLFTEQVPEELVSVYYSRVEEGAWTEPVPVQLSDGARSEEMEAFFAPDGKRIFFAPYDEGMDVRIWSLEVGPDGWRNPRELPSPVADDPAFYPTMSNSGTLYYTNLAARKVYRAELDDVSVSRVEDAGLEFGGHAFIAPDESFVLLDARQPDSLGGSDIYVAFRLPDGSWERPHHLGAEVNSSFDETCPSLSADGRYLFFSRYNEPDEVSDIYWIDSAVIEAARNDTTELLIREAVVELYIKGLQTRDFELIRAICIPEAVLMSVGGEDKLQVTSLDTWSKRFDPANPPFQTLDYSIPRIDIAGTAAQVKILFILDGDRRVTDYLNLLKIEGRWRVVNIIDF